MNKFTILIFVLAMVLASCEKREDKQVQYIATEATAEFSLQYRDENGNIQNETVQAESMQDIWQKNFILEQGEIVYLSGKYNDPQSSLKLIIYVDGKVYKQGSSVGDTLKYLTVSGVVPY